MFRFTTDWRFGPQSTCRGEIPMRGALAAENRVLPK
jgi:hypothetical protein